MTTLYKSDIAADLAETLDCSKAQARRTLDFVLDAIKLAVQNGDTVDLRGFLRLTPLDIPAREYTNPARHNPKNKERGSKPPRVKKPAHRVVRAKVSKTFLVAEST